MSKKEETPVKIINAPERVQKVKKAAVLAKYKVAVSMFAPDAPQMHVVNHLTQDPTTEKRSDFATAGEKVKVKPEVETIIKAFHAAKKPIGVCCISPVLIAKCIPGVSLTVGGDSDENGRWPFHGTTGVIKTLGGQHVVKEVDEAEVDKKNLVVSTPAYMCGKASPYDVFKGIGEMVDLVITL